jgi:hypothetical protein
MADSDVLRAQQELDEEILDRPPRVVAPAVVRVDSETDHVPLAPFPGTLVVYYASPDVGELDTLEAEGRRGERSAVSSLYAMLSALHEQVAAPGGEIDQPTDLEALQRLRQARVLFTVRYGQRTLVERAGLAPARDFGTQGLTAGRRFGTLTFPFVGTELDTAAFQIVEHPRTNDERSNRYVVAFRPPELTDLEQSVAERIRSDAFERTIGIAMASDCAKQVADVVKKAAEDAVKEKHAKTKGCAFEMLDRFNEVIQEGALTPDASIDELVRARHELIVRSMP